MECLLYGESKISQSLNIIRTSQKLKEFKQPGEKEEKRQVYDKAFSITDKPVNFEQIYNR